jgi:hypothetical protein
MPSSEPLPGKCGHLLFDGSGRYCCNPAGKDTDHKGFGHCKKHGGTNVTGDKYGKKLMAIDACDRYGAPITTDPWTVLGGLLAIAWGHVAFYRAAVAEHGAVGDDGRPSVWQVLYQQERSEALKVAETCARVGVEERITRAIELGAEAFVAYGQAQLRALGVDPFSDDGRRAMDAGLAALPDGVDA